MEMFRNIFDCVTFRRVLGIGLVTNTLISPVVKPKPKNLIIDTDFFSDVE